VALDLQPGELGAALVVAVLLVKVGQHRLEIRDARGVLGHALREELVRVVVVILVDAPLGVLERLLQTLAHRRRERRHSARARGRCSFLCSVLFLSHAACRRVPIKERERADWASRRRYARRPPACILAIAFPATNELDFIASD
jgi:hypothetical protein